MLKEMSVGQHTDPPRRRWFTDEDLDLIVWFSEQGAPDGFQLCYDRRGHERALTWTKGAGYRHDRIDDGEGGGPNQGERQGVMQQTEAEASS